MTEPASISVVSLVELQSGTAVAHDLHEKQERQEHYTAILRRFKPLPVDGEVLETFRAVVTAVRAHGRTPRSRMVDLLIAATAASRGWAVLTDNLDDFVGLEGIVEVRAPHRR